MSNEPPYEIARRQSGLIHRRQLRAAGVDPRLVTRKIDSGELIPVTTGLYRLSGAPTTWHQRIWQAILEAQVDAGASRRTAARLHGVGTFTAQPIDVIQVGNPTALVTHGDQQRTLLLPPHHLTTVEGIPVTTIERTIFDLAAMVSPLRRRRGLPTVSRYQVARALDDALARGVPRSRFVAVYDELAGPGRGGTVLMRELLQARGPGYDATESQLEDLLVDVLSTRDLPVPRRQRNLRGLEDRIGRVDFVLSPYNVIVEADSRRHHTQLVDREADQWRDLEFAGAGFVVVRVSWQQLKRDPGRFLDHLERLLRRHGWSPTDAAA